MTLLCVVLLLLLGLALWRPSIGFRHQQPAHYAETAPVFDIRQHLSGRLVSEGMIYGPTGRVVSRFLAEFTGNWDGDSGSLAEEFTYATGATQRRRWRLKIGRDGHFTATAADVIGEGRGVQRGATVQLFYRIRLEPSAGGHVLDVTDWMYLMENGNILNRSEMRKFGVKVAELIATIRPEEH